LSSFLATHSGRARNLAQPANHAIALSGGGNHAFIPPQPPGSQRVQKTLEGCAMKDVMYWMLAAPAGALLAVAMLRLTGGI